MLIVKVKIEEYNTKLRAEKQCAASFVCVQYNDDARVKSPDIKEIKY